MRADDRPIYLLGRGLSCGRAERAARMGRRSLSGLGRPSEPAERGSLLHVSTHAVIVGQAASMKQEAPPSMVG
jgi:hypothetical protein